MWRQAKRERARQIGGWFCEDCGKTLTAHSAQGHHVVPRSAGGKSVVSNCKLRCSQCEHNDPHPGAKHNDARRRRSPKKGEKRIHTQPTSLPRGAQNLGSLSIHIEWSDGNNTVALNIELPTLSTGAE